MNKRDRERQLSYLLADIKAQGGPIDLAMAKVLSQLWKVPVARVAGYAQELGLWSDASGTLRDALDRHSPASFAAQQAEYEAIKTRAARS